MNNQTSIADQGIQIQFTGQITLNRSEWLSLFATMPAREPISPKVTSNADNRLAYGIRETATILGVSNITVYRLLKRGLLKRSLASRKIIIPKFEIERFLRDTL